MTSSAVDQRIKSQRSSKPYVDPYSPHGSLIDYERRPGGKLEKALTIFLAGAECPFACSFCDLWRFTIDGPTPVGALPKQIAKVLADFPAGAVERVKLYNASNFFDKRAVPIEDLDPIASLVDTYSAVTVESHANTIGPGVVEFAERIKGRLEIAMGLETIHADALHRMNKRLELSRFDRAASYLGDNDIDLRVFVLLGIPHVRAEESVEWTARSVEYALERGALVVSVIPVRGGNGELEQLRLAGEWAPPTLSQLEEVLDRVGERSDGTVSVDLWDIDQLATCDGCGDVRKARLSRINLSGRSEPRIECAECNG